MGLFAPSTRRKQCCAKAANDAIVALFICFLSGKPPDAVHTFRGVFLFNPLAYGPPGHVRNFGKFADSHPGSMLLAYFVS